jgi:hypothetical protein
MIGETDTMLKLTSQKTSMIFADNRIKKKQKGLEKIQMATDIVAGKKLVEDTTLSKLQAVNVKFDEKAGGKKNVVTPTKRPAKKKRSSTEISPSPACYPYIETGESHTTFYLSETKQYCLPNPTHKFQPHLYSLREVVYYLSKETGTRKLIEFMNKKGRITFHRNTYEKYAKIYRKQKKLPPEDSYTFVKGRPTEMEKDLLSVTEKTKLSKNTGVDIVAETSTALNEARRLKHGSTAKEVTRATVQKYANAGVASDEDVEKVPHDKFAVVSEARLVASRSLRTCLSQVITAIRTQFVLGQWKDRPNRDELDEGALEMFGYAQDFFPRSLGHDEIRPIHPRYLNNFDDSGRHHNDVASPTIKGVHRYKAISKKGTAKRMKKSVSMAREAEQCDAKTGDVNTKFKVCVNAAGKMAPIVLHFPIFTES